MIDGQPYELSDEETNEINKKHKQCEKELATKPRMDSIGDSLLPVTKIMSEIRRKNGKKPAKKSSTFEDNKKRKKEKKGKSSHSRGHSGSK